MHHEHRLGIAAAVHNPSPDSFGSARVALRGLLSPRVVQVFFCLVDGPFQALYLALVALQHFRKHLDLVGGAGHLKAEVGSGRERQQGQLTAVGGCGGGE